MENKEVKWWSDIASELYFNEDYSKDEDGFDTGIAELVAEASRRERARIIALIKDNHACPFNDDAECPCIEQAIKVIET